MIKTSIERILDTEFDFISKEDKLTQDDINHYQQHLNYISSQGYQISLIKPDNKHYHLTLYNSDNEKLLTRRYKK